MRRARHAQRCFALIAGGGTAGHVLPALAIARALADRGHPIGSVELVGSERGIETRLVPAARFELTVLPGRGFERRLSLRNVRSAFSLLVALARAWRLVARRRPRVVVSVGGYASVPCALAAALRRVPIVVAEQNALPGAANRLVGRFAKVCAVSFEGTPLPRAVVTGNPVRADILAIDRARDSGPARTKLGVDADRRLVLIFGGSLGALRLNQAAVDAARRWADRRDLHMRHVVGSRDWAETTAGGPPVADDGPLRYEALEYDDDMPTSLAAADVAVCRAGSSTCFELLAAGLPAVLVPSPHVTADHHTANARHMERAGAAVVVPDAELDGERLVAEVDALLTAPRRLAQMSDAARAAARPDAATAIAALAEEHARE
ncbi:MAG TPA: undecaprenyldiphospho-muramoylpentapeptide beta-N-acetylglucosaminyltransferase [Acidimicrobiales bacterium]|jgi:undecaprenyldiphospho-muramoylpentapeptide beta-N-acetylglucosaminyltransferase|nr:undecaprenyldiphospho-muramoylpentapeptide beta-N-acetylglucosaminyltransferase [Acidimicrobiales bacterium]